jgi:hypothetical protein
MMADIFSVMAVGLGFRGGRVILQIVDLGISTLLIVKTVRILISDFKKNECEEISRNVQQLVRMITECNYLCEVLYNHGIEWESGWRQLLVMKGPWQASIQFPIIALCESSVSVP